MVGALVLGTLAVPSPASAAGLNLPLQMGQRFLNSPSPPKAVPLPLSIAMGPVRPIAIAGVRGTTFPAIKDPVFGITVFSSSDVKQLVIETLEGVPDETVIAFKVNSFKNPNPNEFAIGGNCVGADGATTPACIATVTFTPKTVGPKVNPISVEISITKGQAEIELALRQALNNQGVVGTLVNLIYPLVRSDVLKFLDTGVQDSLFNPVATAAGVGVAGPFTDPSVFVRRQHADFAGGTPSAAQVSTWVKRFEGGQSPVTLIDALRRADAWQGRIGPVARLYSAYFLRAPDTSGLEYWSQRSRNGTRLFAISSNFAASSEFQRRYGSLSNADFVRLVYRNVLGRSPDAGGLSYWTNQLRTTTRGRVMVGFSESSEYQRKQAGEVATTSVLFGMLKRAPTAEELTLTAARIEGGTPVTQVITEVLASEGYRRVVLGA